MRSRVHCVLALYEALAQQLGLSEEDRTIRLPSGGQSVLQNRIGWAQDALKRAGLSSAPLRGQWLITEEGRKFLERHGGRVPEDEMMRIGSVSRDACRCARSPETAHRSPPATARAISAETRSPREQIEDSLAQIRGSVAQDLLEHVAKQTPAEFEDLVPQRCCMRSDTGMSREALQRVGRSGDGGIDGRSSRSIVSGSRRSACRQRSGRARSAHHRSRASWVRPNSRAQIKVCSSLPAPSRARHAPARQARGNVVMMIDGTRLAALMIEHDVGVTNENLRIPKVDTDFFEGE